MYLQPSRSFRFQNAPFCVVQNIHLVAKWLARLDKKLEQYSEGSNKAYRVYMSAEPAGSREGHIIPQGILECAIKITNEPPTGMRANLHKALDNFTQVTPISPRTASVHGLLTSSVQSTCVSHFCYCIYVHFFCHEHMYMYVCIHVQYVCAACVYTSMYVCCICTSTVYVNIVMRIHVSVWCVLFAWMCVLVELCSSFVFA